jgi:hypothetical protein
MIRKILSMVIVLIVLAISGCTENGAQIADNNTTDTPANATANASEHAERQSVSIPLERPPFLEDE